MNTSKQDPLDAALAGLKAVIVKLPSKTQSLVTDWIIGWSHYLKFESKFKPERVPRFKRGDIVYVDFGFNIGNEYGGVHYAAVLENNNHKRSGTITVIPLTSLKDGETPANLTKDNLYLGEVIPWTQAESVAKPTQIKAVSKMRIIRPLKKGDQRARLTPAHLDLIDDRIKQIIINNNHK